MRLPPQKPKMRGDRFSTFQFQSETRRYQIPPPLFIALKITEKTLSDFFFCVSII